MQKELLNKIQKEFQNIKSRYHKQYGAVIFDIEIKSVNNNIILEGVVLSERQKKEAFLAVQEILKNIVIKNEIKVLSEPNEKLEIGWGIIRDSIVDIWNVFPGKKLPACRDRDACGGLRRGDLIRRSRASQAVKGDIVRLLAKKGSYYLAQTQDMAVGWIKKSEISVQSGCASGGKNQKLISKWKNIKKIEVDKTIDVNLTDKTRKKFIAFLENYLYVPYVLGGTTELGIDCSGLTQKFYREIFGILLPRHSADQAGYGEKTSLEKARFGDLIFLREKTKKHPHIGIIIDKFKTLNAERRTYDNILILNARREKGEAVIQSAEEILKDYDLISVKRLISFK